MIKRIESICLIIIDNRTQLIEILVIPIIIWLINKLNLADILSEIIYYRFNYQISENHGLLSIIGIYGFCVLKYNRNETMNVLNIYHDYCYAWYFFCAKVLRIRKCNLVHVPIAMQLNLCINSTFKEYVFNEKEIPSIDSEIIKIRKLNWISKHHIVNLILEDTYPVCTNQIPEELRDLPTLIISRNNGDSFSRHYSRPFIDSILTELHKLNDGVQINLFATTNPRHTHSIAKSAFMNASKGNIVHLRVFQYLHDIKIYDKKGVKIF